MRDRILDGTLASGRLLTEGEVAESVGISRTPVREAFLQLEAEHMLRLYPKRGALVVSVDAADLREVLVARSLIEPWAATTVASRGDRAQTVAELRTGNARIQAALQAGDDRAFQQTDRELHERLVAAAGNELLNDFYSTLRDRQMRGGSRALADNPERGETIVDQHRALISALERGDGAAATALLREHLRDTALALGLAPIDDVRGT